MGCKFPADVLGEGEDFIVEGGARPRTSAGFVGKKARSWKWTRVIDGGGHRRARAR